MSKCMALLAALALPAAAEKTADRQHQSPASSIATGSKTGKKDEADRKKAKTRTLKELIDSAMKEGRDRTMDSVSADNLEFQGEVKTKAVRCKSSQAPDKKQHVFSVAYIRTEDGLEQPQALVWDVGQITSKEGDKFLDGWTLRVSLEGKLVAIFHAAGKVGEVQQVKYSVDSQEAIDIFVRERSMLLENSPPLSLSAK